MSIRTPIYNGLLQSDLDVNHFNLLNYAGGGGGGGGSGLPAGWVSVMDYGAHADGATDDTAAVQAAIAAAGSVVYFPPGHYFFAGSIGVVPDNISLVGASFLGPFWYPYSHTPLTTGTSILMLTAGAGSGSGTKFISLGSNSAVIGLTFYWPNQVASGSTPTAYPWAIYCGPGNASSVKYCAFVNGYQCIYSESNLDVLIEEIRGTALYCGVKLEGNNSVTRLRGCYFDDQWLVGSTLATWAAANAVAFEVGRVDLLIMESCFAYHYKTWIHFYDDPPHTSGGTLSCAWAQIRGGGGDVCVTCVDIYTCQPYGIDLDGIHINAPGGLPIQVQNTNSGSVRIRNSMMYCDNSQFGVVGGTGEVSVDGTYFVADQTNGTAPVASANIGWAVGGTGNFALRNCVFKTTQTHVSLGASLTKAVITGNMCSDTFVVSNSMAAGSAVIDGNTGQGTVYVGSDMRLVAISGGAKIQVRNTGTGTWVDADQWTNP